VPTYKVIGRPVHRILAQEVGEGHRLGVRRSKSSRDGPVRPLNQSGFRGNRSGLVYSDLSNVVSDGRFKR
jgi:hypothetical protein